MPKAVCGAYNVFTDKEKAELATRVTEHGIISTIHYFTKIGGAKSKNLTTYYFCQYFNSWMES